MINQRPYYKGIELLQEIPNIKLYELNNLLLEYDLFSGLTMINGKVFGIIATIEK